MNELAHSGSLRLTDQVAVVTGGARGIGVCIVERFVEEGARVVFSDLLDDKAEYLENELGKNTAFYREDATKGFFIKVLGQSQAPSRKPSHGNHTVNGLGLNGPQKKVWFVLYMSPPKIRFVHRQWPLRVFIRSRKEMLVGASGQDTDFCKTPFSTYRRLNQWLLEKASSDTCPFFRAPC